MFRKVDVFSRMALLFLLCSLPTCALLGSSEAQNASDRLIQHPNTVKSLPSKSKRWALLIGVDKYDDSNISPLKGAANDARGLKQVLVDYAGFPQDQVIVLSSDEPSERQPTRTNILRRLSNLTGLVPKDGLLLISFAGHGIDRNGQAFLIPSDATFTEDTRLLEETAISINGVKERIKETGVQQVMIFLDACRSYPTGRSGTSNPLTPAFINALDFDVRNREVSAFAVLYATEVGHRAYEYGEKHQGYFTWAIMQGLNGAAANERGEVTLGTLLKYIEDTVPKLVAIDYGANVIQKPFANIEGYRADELVLAVATPNALIAAPGSYTGPGETSGQLQIGRSQQSQPTTTRKRGEQGTKVLLNVTLRQAGGSAVYDSELDGTFLELLSRVNVQAIDVSSLDTKARTRSLNEIEMLRSPGDFGAVLSRYDYELAIDADLVINDRLPSGADGMFVANISGLLRVFDYSIGRAVITKNLSIRGFGLDRSQAISNAKRNVHEGLTDEVLAKIADYAK